MFYFLQTLLHVSISVKLNEFSFFFMITLRRKAAINSGINLEVLNKEIRRKIPKKLYLGIHINIIHTDRSKLPTNRTKLNKITHGSLSTILVLNQSY